MNIMKVNEDLFLINNTMKGNKKETIKYLLNYGIDENEVYFAFEQLDDNFDNIIHFGLFKTFLFTTDSREGRLRC